MRHLPRGRPGARAVPQADDATWSTPSTSSPAAPTATRARCCATRCTPPRSPAAPVENACRLIKQYESEGRGYYGAALALLGRDAEGEPIVDSPIVIRTADVDLDGRLTVTAGATLVRDSDPAYEVAETHAKAGGILSAFGLVAAGAGARRRTSPSWSTTRTCCSRSTRATGGSAAFWLTDQAGAPPDPRLARQARGDPRRRGRLREHAAPRARRARHDQRAWSATTDYADRARLDGADLVIVGPGPGDPRDGDDPKIARAPARRSTGCSTREQPFLAVCLGHQALCHRLGIPLAYKDIVFQGTQSPVPIDGRTERVGFYNTFVGRVGDGDAARRASRSRPTRRPATSTWSRGPHYRGIQFHAESILTEHGYDLIHDLVRDLLV